jgi:UDP-glucose 4-epimerase
MLRRKIIITGGAGFIGAALANELSNNPSNEIVCIDNLSTGNWKRLNGNVTRIDTSIQNLSVTDLAEIFSGAETLFHLAAVKLHNQHNSFHDILLNNVSATEQIVNAAGLAGVKKVVFTSSLYAYGSMYETILTESNLPKPITTYGASKVFGENLIHIASKKYGFKYAIARLFFIYGENQFAEGGYKSVIVSNFERINSGLPAIINGDGQQILDYLHVEDCVRALIQLEEVAPCEIVNISSGIPLSIESLTKKMLAASIDEGVIFGKKDWTHGSRRVGSNGKLLRLTGWQPMLNIEEGLARTWRNLQ